MNKYVAEFIGTFHKGSVVNAAAQDRDDWMNEIKVPPDIEFHEDIRLLICRPRGVQLVQMS